LLHLKQLFAAIRTLGKHCTQVKFDNGGEFVNHNVSQYLLDEGIRQETTSPHTPHQNGIAERSNRTVCELTVAMMLTAKTPYYLWEYAMKTAVMLLNYFPCQALGMTSTPHLEVVGSPPVLSHLKIFGCDVYASIPEHEQSVLGPRCWKGTFIGYDYSPTVSSLAYLWYHPARRKVYKSGHVQFNEDISRLEFTQAEQYEFDKTIHDIIPQSAPATSHHFQDKIEDAPVQINQQQHMAEQSVIEQDIRPNTPNEPPNEEPANVLATHQQEQPEAQHEVVAGE
jgi:hypothetical protein